MLITFKFEMFWFELVYICQPWLKGTSLHHWVVSVVLMSLCWTHFMASPSTFLTIPKSCYALHKQPLPYGSVKTAHTPVYLACLRTLHFETQQLGITLKFLTQHICYPRLHHTLMVHSSYFCHTACPSESYAQKMGSQTSINPSAADDDMALSVKKILKTADYACS